MYQTTKSNDKSPRVAIILTTALICPPMSLSFFLASAANDDCVLRYGNYNVVKNMLAMRVIIQLYYGYMVVSRT